MVKLVCGFALLTKWCLQALFPRLQLCLSGAQRALGEQPAGPWIPVGTCHAARLTDLLSVLAFGTRSWNVCIRKQLGLRGTLHTPPGFLISVTFSSGF